MYMAEAEKEEGFIQPGQHFGFCDNNNNNNLLFLYATLMVMTVVILE